MTEYFVADFFLRAEWISASRNDDFVEQLSFFACSFGFLWRFGLIVWINKLRLGNRRAAVFI
jgi:hypothetical protein